MNTIFFWINTKHFYKVLSTSMFISCRHHYSELRLFFAFPSSPCGPLSLPLPSCLHTPNHSLPHLRPENHKLAGRGHYPLTKTSLGSKVQRSNRHCGLQVFFFHSGQALKVTYFQRYDYERLDTMPSALREYQDLPHSRKAFNFWNITI